MKRTSKDNQSKLCVILEDTQQSTISSKVSVNKLDIRSIQNVWDNLFTKSPDCKNMELYAVYHKGNHYHIRAMSKRGKKDNILVLLQFSSGKPKDSIVMVEKKDATKQVRDLFNAIYTHKKNMKSVRRLMLAKMATSAAGVGGGAIYLYHKYNKHTRQKQTEADDKKHTENRTSVHQVDKTCEKNRKHTRSKQDDAGNEEYTENRTPVQQEVDEDCENHIINATDLATRFQCLGLPDHLGVIDKSTTQWDNHKILVHALRDTIQYLSPCQTNPELLNKIKKEQYDQITAKEIDCVTDEVKKRLTEIMPRYIGLNERSPYTVAEEPFDSGQMGKVYKATKDNNNYVIKIQYTCYAFRNEIHAHVRLIGADIVPKVVDSFICVRETHTVYAIVMEELQGTILDFLKERLNPVRDENGQTYFTLGDDVNKKAMQQIKDIYHGLTNRGVYHTDLHPKNLMYRQTDRRLDFKFYAIDLGNAAISSNLRLNAMLWAPYHEIPYLATKQQAYNYFKNREDRIERDTLNFLEEICLIFSVILDRKFNLEMYNNLLRDQDLYYFLQQTPVTKETDDMVFEFFFKNI